MQHYDVIGANYTARRRADPRIAASINSALGEAQRILNVGAGTGSYEPNDRRVTAVEPSRVLIAQRPPKRRQPFRQSPKRFPFGTGRSTRQWRS